MGTDSQGCPNKALRSDKINLSFRLLLQVARQPQIAPEQRR